MFIKQAMCYGILVALSEGGIKLIASKKLEPSVRQIQGKNSANTVSELGSGFFSVKHLDKNIAHLIA